MAFDSLSPLILQVYRSAREMPTGEFQDFMGGLVRSIVPFDSSRWVTLEMMDKGAKVLSAHLIDEPTEVVLDWASINKKDKVMHAVLANPGKPLSIHAKSYYAGREFAEIRDYAQHYRHANTLVTGMYVQYPRIAEGFSLYRARQEDCFDDQNRCIVEQLMPHLVEALATNRALSLARAGMAELAPEQAATAVLGTNGLIHFAGSGFNHLMRLEWPDWTGPRLPSTLWQLFSRVGVASFTGTSIQVAIAKVGDLLFLKASRLCPLQRLSPRELAVAQLYGSGFSHKEVARRLEISPVTVRNFLQRIYAKLEIRDKAELAACVARTRRDT